MRLHRTNECKIIVAIFRTSSLSQNLSDFRDNTNGPVIKFADTDCLYHIMTCHSHRIPMSYHYIDSLCYIPFSSFEIICVLIRYARKAVKLFLNRHTPAHRIRYHPFRGTILYQTALKMITSCYYVHPQVKINILIIILESTS